MLDTAATARAGRRTGDAASPGKYPGKRGEWCQMPFCRLGGPSPQAGPELDPAPHPRASGRSRPATRSFACADLAFQTFLRRMIDWIAEEAASVGVRASARDLKGKSMTSEESLMWIEDGEKYALVGLEVTIAKHFPLGRITRNLWVFTNTAFDVPSHWQEWLGGTRTREVKGCNLFLLPSKLASVTPDVLDAENQKLQRRVWEFYVGLLLASTFAPAHRPVVLTGSKRDGEIGVRQQQDLNHLFLVSSDHIQPWHLKIFD